MTFTDNGIQTVHLFWKRPGRKKNVYDMQKEREVSGYTLLRSVLLPSASISVFLLLFLHLTGQIEYEWLLVFLAGILSVIYQLLGLIGKRTAALRTILYLFWPVLADFFQSVRKAGVYEWDLYAQGMNNYGRRLVMKDWLRGLFVGEEASIADAVPPVSAQLVFILGMCSLGIVILCFVQKKKEWLLPLIVGAVFAWFLLIIGAWPGTGSAIFLLIMMLLFLASSVEAGIMGIAVATFLSLMMLIRGGLLLENVSPLRSAWEDFRYHMQSEVLPDGDMRKATGLSRQKTNADLKVTMSKRQSTYLRGFTGAVYEHDCWTMNPKRLRMMETAKGLVVDEGSDLNTISDNGWISILNILHRHMFYGLTQLSQSKGNSGYVSYEIENTGGNRKHLYIPYETLGSWMEGQKAAAIGSGEKLTAVGLTGKRHYEVNATESAIGQVQDFNLETEDSSLYQNYVQATCLNLSKNTKEYFSELLDAREDQDSMTSVIDKVKSYLNKNISYEKNPGAIPDQSDFLVWFFEKNKKGNDVHFACAAALMFRYYGIPSRYVEGYVLPEILLQGSQGNSVMIPETYAHAWPEIYIKGAGWIPVEVVERYEHLMKPYYEPDQTIHNESQDHSEEGTEMTEEESPADSTQSSESEYRREPSSEESEEWQSSDAQIGDRTKDKKGVPWILLMVLLAAAVLVRAYLKKILYLLRLRHYQRNGSYNEAVVLSYDRMSNALKGLERYTCSKQKKRTGSFAKPGDNRLGRMKQRIRLSDKNVQSKEIEKNLMIHRNAVYGYKTIGYRQMRGAVRFFDHETGVFIKKVPLLRRIFGEILYYRKDRRHVDS